MSLTSHLCFYVHIVWGPQFENISLRRAPYGLHQHYAVQHGAPASGQLQAVRPGWLLTHAALLVVGCGRHVQRYEPLSRCVWGPAALLPMHASALQRQAAAGVMSCISCQPSAAPLMTLRSLAGLCQLKSRGLRAGATAGRRWIQRVMPIGRCPPGPPVNLHPLRLADSRCQVALEARGHASSSCWPPLLALLRASGNSTPGECASPSNHLAHHHNVLAASQLCMLCIPV